MARRILNRKELRANYEAAEHRKKDGEETDELEDEDEDEADETETAEAEEEGGEGDEEEAPKKRKAAAKPVKPKTRSRAAKMARLKVVWGVFNNSNQRVAVFDYPKRREAEEMAAKLSADKKSTHFIQPIKEPMDEKKEA